MTVKIKMNTKGAAFEGENKPFEMARILREIAGEMEEGVRYGHIIDSNGNTVGTWAL